MVGKLCMRVCVFASVNSVSFNSICFYCYFSLLEARLGLFGFLVSDVGIYGTPAFEGALPCGGTFALRWPRRPVTGGLLRLLEKPDIYNGLYLLGKKADSFIEQEKTCWHKVFH